MSDKKTTSIPVNRTFHRVAEKKYKKLETLNATDKYWEYRHKWAFNPKNFIIEKAPIHLDIETTSLCNLRCTMCSMASKDYYKNRIRSGNMSMDLYKKIIDEAVEIGVYSTKLFYVGEPLMNKNIAEMVRYAKQKGIIDVSITTNAVLLDERMSRSLIEAGLDNIAFSFDSPYKKRYEAIRVGANFEDTLQNIRKFSQLRDEYNATKPMSRVTMVMMDNVPEEFDDFINLFEGIVDAVGFYDYFELDDKLVDLAKLDNISDDDFICAQLWQRLIINWEGLVGPCCFDETFSSKIGNINDESIASIWNGEKLNTLRKLHATGKWKQLDFCRRCQASLINSTQNHSDGSI